MNGINSESIKEKLTLAGRRNRKYAAFIALLMVAEDLRFDDGEKGNEDILLFLNSIGMPDSYLHHVRSILRVKSELLREGYKVQKTTTK